MNLEFYNSRFAFPVLGAVGIKQSGRSRHNRRFLSFFVHCVDTINAVTRNRPADSAGSG